MFSVANFSISIDITLNYHQCSSGCGHDDQDGGSFYKLKYRKKKKKLTEVKSIFTEVLKIVL